MGETADRSSDDDENVSAHIPSTDIEAAALRPQVASLLELIPTTWADFDADTLTDQQSRALFLLVAAGMVERRGWVRTTIANHPTCFEWRFQATGERGFSQVLEKATAIEFETWKIAWAQWQYGESRSQSPFHAQSLKPDEWRLTNQGEIAREELRRATCATDQLTVLDFVLKSGLYGPGYWARRFLSGHEFSDEDRRILESDGRDLAELSRPPVAGCGQLLEIRKVDHSPMPQSVTISNWAEGATELAQVFAQMMGPMFETRAAQEAQRKPAPECDEDPRDVEYHRERDRQSKLSQAGHKVSLPNWEVWFGPPRSIDLKQLADDIVAYARLAQEIDRSESLDYSIKTHIKSSSYFSRKAARMMALGRDRDAAAILEELEKAIAEPDIGPQLHNIRRAFENICLVVYRNQKPPIPFVEEGGNTTATDEVSQPPQGAGHAAAPKSANPVLFRGGIMAFYRDRVELCGIAICSGRRSKTARQALDLLREKRADGSFAAYDGNTMANKLGLAGQNAAAGLIRDLRKRIIEALARANIECGMEDVILSGGSGYRFAAYLSVQWEGDLGQAEGQPSDAPDDTDRDEPDDPDDRDTDEPDDTNQQAAERRAWILEQLGQNQKLQAPHIKDHFKCSIATAKRDLARLKEEGLVEFVGPARTGYYQLRRQR